MSIIDVKKLAAWLEIGRTDDGSTVKLLFTTMPNGTAAKHATLHNIQNLTIPQSLVFDFQSTFSDRSSTLSNTMCSDSQFEKEARQLGLNNDDTLVVYDNYGNFCASRVWFMCKAMGFEKVLVLDGGLPKWISAGYATITRELPKNAEYNEQEDLDPTESPGTFTVSRDERFKFVDQYYVKSVLSQHTLNVKSECILDARGAARFTGESKDPRPNVRSGHIPTSLNLHYAQLQDEWGAFLPLEELKEIFAQLETPASQFVFSCGSGVTACILAQAASMLNISPLRVYDGSWSEWGGSDTLPISSGLV
jgi:thiosulfate/3-mercaptopyruvate sulfurtransferase